MIVVDVDWYTSGKLPEGVKPYTLRLIYDSSFSNVSSDDFEYRIRRDVKRFVGQEDTPVLFKVTFHHTISDCVGFHGLDSDSDMLFLRFGYFKTEEDDCEESVIPRSRLIDDVEGSDG